MYARSGRPPKPPDKPVVTLTLRVPAAVKTYLIEASENLDMSITEYLVTLVKRDAGGEVL
jgi:hypothetical protein